MVRALQYVAAHGLPGQHHFYLSFRTDHPGVSLPARLRAQYPREMTIVLQHQFWDLAVDEAAAAMSVVLSFGGVPSTLRIPFAAITAFEDRHVGYGLGFRPDPTVPAEPDPEPAPAPDPATAGDAPAPAPQVVQLDAFRRRPPPKES